MLWCVLSVNPRVAVAGTGRSLELAFQLVYPNWWALGHERPCLKGNGCCVWEWQPWLSSGFHVCTHIYSTQTDAVALKIIALQPNEQGGCGYFHLETGSNPSSQLHMTGDVLCGHSSKYSTTQWYKESADGSQTVGDFMFRLAASLMLFFRKV